MIFDTLKNATLYLGMGDRLAAGLKYLQQTDFSEVLPGKYEIDGKNIYASVQSYDTNPEEKCNWEAHRKYIDIQFIINGCEKMGVSNISSLQVSKEYDEENDYLLLTGSGDYLTVNSSSFVVFYPEDAHKPGIAAGEPQPIKKVVVKVAV